MLRIKDSIRTLPNAAYPPLKLVKADLEGPRFCYVLIVAGEDYSLSDFPEEDHR